MKKLLQILSSGPVLMMCPRVALSSIYIHLDPPEICRLAALNRAFRGASSADFVWEKKLPSNYRYLVENVLGQSPDTLSKKETFARLCRPNRLDGGTKANPREDSVDGCATSIKFMGGPNSRLRQANKHHPSATCMNPVNGFITTWLILLSTTARIPR
ncbi:DNA-directed RNA polymerases II, IV and V subunit 6A-like [Hibiscus syriacus]|uniref:DNA-directed RNA polymerases II, IV and V subunit 6A-like n=1 Tax=Hibiscus syriacus TaxID=106335 RepID=A0A6A2XUR9_HIBSY|nr:DNA-directed RNA polymerases II, IV and V subunit 6A-like [Hibiscus syriacus]